MVLLLRLIDFIFQNSRNLPLSLFLQYYFVKILAKSVHFAKARKDNFRERRKSRLLLLSIIVNMSNYVVYIKVVWSVRRFVPASIILTMIILHLDDGRTIVDKKSILLHSRKFYSDLYSPDPVDVIAQDILLNSCVM